MDTPAQVGADRIWAEVSSPPRRAPALFLDRDGVVVQEVHFLHEPSKVRLIPGAAAVIACANAQGLHVVLITNQSGIGRGHYGWAEFAAVQARVLHLLAEEGARLDAVFACPFHPDAEPPFRHPAHPARKPNPGMLERARDLLDIDLAASWIVGDRIDDVGAGRNAGLAGAVHVLTGYGHEHRRRAQALAGRDFTVLTADSIAGLPGLMPLLPACSDTP